MIIMKKTPQLLPKHLRAFKTLGENLKLARLRRNLTAEMVAQRAGISRMTLNKIENERGWTIPGVLTRMYRMYNPFERTP